MSTQTPKIAVIISSTRAARFADKPAAWLMAQAEKRDDFTAELVDLRDFDLPFFDEMASNKYMPSQDPKALAWQKKIAEFDGYVIVTAEYNHSITGALKNALDQAYVEWNRKPVGAIGYGGVGAARAIEHLRGIAVELEMVPVRTAVHIGGADFIAVHPMGANGEMETIEAHISDAATTMFDEIVWWANATMAARAPAASEAA
ncbi:NADPH-dependent FMN reductase [Flavimaricola marinus]|uniref:FMN-dependent NADPH-azoreductase n=1 Tax=Flavimaricola marinus TaxID=1819565 RepID=A0A238LEA2_9RHOB|nr:NADPH-dependent FMN reductase [Flavimaricola marinus]SMY07735.1 FMN-dependent NADPH-azoreductase [Flavimaricola marinus]